MIREKVLQRIKERVLDNSKAFLGCKTIEDVLTELGSSAWEVILYEVGYNINLDSIVNYSPRFISIFDEVLAKLGEETEEKILKMTMLYNVIAKCTDGDVKIGKDGIYDFNYDEAKEIANAHKNLGFLQLQYKLLSECGRG